jgi:nicotinamidase-related amidase
MLAQHISLLAQTVYKMGWFSTPKPTGNADGGAETAPRRGGRRLGWLVVSTADLDPRRTALILIDLMPRIVAFPTAPIPGSEVLRRCVALAAAVRAAGGLVVFVRVERPDADVQPAGSELAAECAPQPGDIQIIKRTWGAFHHTRLDDVLRAHDIGTVVLAGLVTNFGVESTGRAADEHGYSVVFVSDAMAGLEDHAHAFAVEYVFPRLGAVCTSEEILDSVG